MQNPYTVIDGIACVELSQGQVARVDSSDLPLIAGHKWYALWHPDTRSYYASGNVNVGGKRTTIYMHRLITGAPKGMKVDHENHDTLDNRRFNLRICTNQQNMENRRGANVNSKTGIRGVSVHRCHPTGLQYVARVHKPTGKGYYCSYFAFSVGGLNRAIAQVGTFLEQTSHGTMHEVPESPESIHGRMCVEYAEDLARTKRKSRSAETL